MRSTFYSQTLTLAAGARVPVNCTGEFFLLSEATANVQASLEHGRPFFAVIPGLEFRMEPGEHFEVVFLYNPNGSPVTLTFYAGFGAIQDQRKTISLDAATVSSIVTGFRAGAGRVMGARNLSDQDVTFTGKIAVTITNTHSTQSMTVTNAGGLNFTIPAGQQKSWSVANGDDWLTDFTVNTSAATLGVASTAEVIYL